MTGIILAGGKNTRIGTNKALLKIGESSIIENTISLLTPLFDSILIVTSSAEAYRSFGLRIVKDVQPGKGPLVAIYSGLLAAESKWNFVVGCDMPFLNSDLIKYMKEQCNGFDAVVPKLNSYYESLHAFYNKSCLKTIEKQLGSNDLKINSLFGNIKVREVTREETSRFGDTHMLFFNVNTLSDLSYAQSLVK